MAQPDFERMNTGAQMILHEIECIPNLPLLTQANQLEQILTQLAQMRQDNQRFQNDIRGQVDQVKENVNQNINQLREEHNQFRQEVRQSFQTMSKRIDAVSHNSQVRSWNNTVRHRDVALSPLVTDDGREIPNFPADLKAITSLTAATSNPLLTACKLNAHGLNMEEKKQRFSNFIGAVYSA